MAYVPAPAALPLAPAPSGPFDALVNRYVVVQNPTTGDLDQYYLAAPVPGHYQFIVVSADARAVPGGAFLDHGLLFSVLELRQGPLDTGGYQLVTRVSATRRLPPGSAPLESDSLD